MFFCSHESPSEIYSGTVFCGSIFSARHFGFRIYRFKKVYCISHSFFKRINGKQCKLNCLACRLLG